MQQSLAMTTLAGLREGSRINVERAAKDGAEIGGHPLSGHIDFMARVAQIRRPENNCVLRFEVPAPWMRYVFAKGYIAINGASLTVAEAQRERDGSGWFEVWLIPETLRMTTFADKVEGDAVNLEIERSTQVFVDTVRSAIDERLGPLVPLLEGLMLSTGQVARRAGGAHYTAPHLRGPRRSQDMAMSTGQRAAITVAVVAAFGGALFFALRGQQETKAVQQQAIEVANTVQLKGLIALDVEGYFKDERVIKALAAKKMPVEVARVGSRDMAGKVVAGSSPDFFFASGVVAANQIVDAARKANLAATQMAPFHTPMVIASREPIARSWWPTASPRRCRPRSTAWTWPS